MSWEKELDTAAREASRIRDRNSRDAFALLIAVVDRIARETLPLDVDPSTGLPRPLAHPQPFDSWRPGS